MSGPPVIYIDNNLIDPLMIKEFHLITDTNSLFYTGALLAKDTSNILAASVKFGSEVRIQYVQDTGKILLDTPMRVLSCKKIASAHPSIFDEVQISFISAWYFKQQAVTRAFFGSVSQIIEEVVSKEWFFRKKSIETSTDAPRIRYQIAKSSAEFLTEIKKYAVSNLSGMLLYCTPARELVLTSHTTIANSSPLYELVPFLGGKNQETAVSRDLPLIPIYSMSLHITGEHTASTRKYIFTAAHVQPGDLASTKLSITLPTIETEETQLISTQTGAEGTIRGWEINPSDAVAMAINETASKDDQLFSGVVVIPCALDYNLTLGNVVKLNTNTPALPENGKYFIAYIDYFYTEGNFFTKMQLVRIPK